MNDVRRLKKKHQVEKVARRDSGTDPARTADGGSLGAAQSWVRFWFRPIDPVGLHALRVLAGLLLIAWLLPMFGHAEALFGLDGWFDQDAYREAARLPLETQPQFGWSILYLCGTNSLLLKVMCAVAIVVLMLFTLGIATRLTAIASWVIAVSFTANPAFAYDADGLLVLLSFYLMIGYLFLNQTDRGQSMAARWLGSREQILFFNRPAPDTRDVRVSVAANVALRLLQVHLAMTIVASGLHKLQFGDWWAGVALWYPLYPPLSATIKDARTYSNHDVALLAVLSLAAYAVLAWQIAFPAFAWKPRCRKLLLGGAFVGCLGCVWLYELPLFGSVLFVGCLSFLTPCEWHRIRARLRLVRSITAAHRIPSWLVIMSALLGLVSSGCAPVGESSSNSSMNNVSPAETEVGVLPEMVDESEDPKILGNSVNIPDGLRQRIDAAIDQVQQREVQTSHGFWTVLHGLLGVGIDLTLVDPATGSRVSAIDAISGGGEVRGMRFIPTPDGLEVQNGPMFVGQGHMDQFVAEMLQVGLPPDHPFVVDGKQYTLMDFVRHAQSRVRVTEDQELSWSIIVIGECLGTDAQWTNRFGESLRFEDLVRYELDQDIEAAACGGTHRLFGLDWVYQLHVRNGGAVTGVWQEVAEKTRRYQDRAQELQNPDGSFSTEFFRGSADVDDMKQRISSTGHILEWLASSLPDEQLQADWVRDAANALSLMILDIQSAPMEGGTLYHALHGLRIYRSRCSHPDN
ncbi:MAG TPA: hypothetical protein PLR25_13450 [Planctomycetaceae bacterium]|nr:hypothetical protein [Planctomycetaceae bacterium]